MKSSSMEAELLVFEKPKEGKYCLVPDTMSGKE
jgi:hypothetical protein